jgi:hypothetical protein
MASDVKLPRTTGRYRAWVIKSMLLMPPGNDMYWDDSVGNWTHEIGCATRYGDATEALLIVGALAEKFPIYCKVEVYRPQGPLIGSVFVELAKPDQPYFVVDSGDVGTVAYVNAAGTRGLMDVSEFADMLDEKRIRIVVPGCTPL